VSLQAGAQPFLTLSGVETRSRGFKRGEEMSEAAACSGFVVEKEEQKSLVKSL
jgi:hypothetical protein